MVPDLSNDYCADQSNGQQTCFNIPCLSNSSGPRGHCSVGNPEYGVADDISPNNAPDSTVTDENWISNGGVLIGVMYKGADQNIYVQPYYGDSPGMSFGITLFGTISVGQSTPGAWGPVTKWNGMLPPGSRVHKCWTRAR